MLLVGRRESTIHLSLNYSIPHPSSRIGSTMASERRSRSSYDTVYRGNSRGDPSIETDYRHQNRERRESRGYETSRTRQYREGDDSASNRDRLREREPNTSSKWDRYSDNDWKCMECRSWNTDRDDACFRCDRRPHHFDHNPRTFSERSARTDPTDDLDEFGRPKKRPKLDQTTLLQWPPPFDKRNATYVFDAISGMFYHSISQFFFHPSTKLYFSNKEQKYFRHSPGEESPFQPVEHEKQQEETTTISLHMKAPTIAITLKTKILPGKDSAKTQQLTPEEKVSKIQKVGRTQKTYAAFIDRWSTRDRLKTREGKPICPWCRRKFTDLSHLQRHEEQSEQHKRIMTKWKHQQSQKDHEYRDRARERRNLHGPDNAPVVAMEDQSVAVTSVDTRPESNLGEDNIGNKMLQKLGWKLGKSLGALGDTPNHLVKDWERIEFIAKHGAGK